MAKDITGPIWVFDTVNDDLVGTPFENSNPHIDTITFITDGSNAGTFTLIEGVGGTILAQATLAVDDEEQFVLGVRVGGLRLSAAPTSGFTVLIKHGDL